MAVKSVRGVLLLILLTLVCTGACRSDQAYNLRILPGFAQSPGWKARDINDAGQVAGYTTTGQAVFCEANGLVRELTRPSGYISCGIHGINNAGDCVGYAEDASGNGCGVLWRADGTPVLLPALPGDYQCVARDLNDSGQSVGVSRGQQDRAVIWDRDGNVTDLAALAGGWMPEPPAVRTKPTVTAPTPPAPATPVAPAASRPPARSPYPSHELSVPWFLGSV